MCAAREARAIATTAVVHQGASVFGLPHATTPEVAAFANTAMVRYIDFNDTGHGGHPSDTVAAVLAAAEWRRTPGRDVVTAIYAAYVAYAAVRRAGLLGDALRRRHVDQIYASFGSVVGVGVVLGLDTGRMTHAISLAITPSVPLRVTRTGVISEWKGCATVHSAMTAVFAARRAQHALIGTAQPIWGTDDLALDQIDRVDVFLHWSGWHEIDGGAGDAREKSAPRTRETADHSLAYVVAVALVDGAVTIDSFDDERRRDPALRRMTAKIGVHEDPKLTAAHAGEVPTWPSRVEIRLRDGSVHVRESGPPRGHPARPLSDGEIEAKYFALADRVMPRAGSRRLRDPAWQVAALDDIGTLTRQFGGCGRQPPVP